MLQTVQCPHCGRDLAIDARHVGTSVVCPLCKASFVPPGRPEALPVARPAASPAVTARPDAPRPALDHPDLTPARAFAEEAGLDLDEEHFESVSGGDAAERRLREWREDMPEVPSAYRPSGKLPVGGAVGLFFGTFLGAAGGALALLLLGGVVVGLTVGVVALIVFMSEACGRVFCVLYLLAFAVALLGGAASFAVQGWLSALIATALGIAGKNRNVAAAVVASVAACVLGLALALWAADWAGEALLRWAAPEEAAKQAAWTWVDWVALGGGALGCVLAVVLAAFCGQGMVRDSKFCEECEEYMEDQAKPGVGLGPAKVLVAALKARRFAAAADALRSRVEKCAVPTLYFCAKCERGYLEVQANFACHWTKDKDREEKEAQWLAASEALEPEQTDLFRERPRRAGASDG